MIELIQNEMERRHNYLYKFCIFGKSVVICVIINMEVGSNMLMAKNLNLMKVFSSWYIEGLSYLFK